MDLALVARILQIGFSGFAFLMAYLSFNLLRQEMARPSARRQVLAQVRWYMVWTLSMAMAVAALSITQTVLRAKLGSFLSTADADEVIRCEERLVVLATLSKDAQADLVSLQSAVGGFEEACGPMLRNLGTIARSDR